MLKFIIRAVLYLKTPMWAEGTLWGLQSSDADLQLQPFPLLSFWCSAVLRWIDIIFHVMTSEKEWTTQSHNWDQQGTFWASDDAILDHQRSFMQLMQLFKCWVCSMTYINCSNNTNISDFTPTTGAVRKNDYRSEPFDQMGYSFHGSITVKVTLISQRCNKLEHYIYIYNLMDLIISKCNLCMHFLYFY